MELIESKRGMQAFGRSKAVVLVPTMGALHAGHEALVRRGVELAGQRGGACAVSIFVNPAQFDDPQDFARYPVTLEADLELCARAGAAVAFVPAAAEVYAADASVKVVESALARLWEGESRPGHFDGVCLVVAKLFHLTHARAAVFGEKDWQQLAIVRRMVRDLDFDLEIKAHPTLREQDGLALSSRNRRLGAAARAAAPGIFAALEAMRVAAGRGAEVAEAEGLGRETLSLVNGLEVDYLAVVDELTLERRRADAAAAGSRALFAGWLDGVRLIDNLGLSGWAREGAGESA